MYNNLCKKILKLMNLDRGLSKQEQRFVVEWKERLDMKDEIILEAVKRAVAYKGERAGFAYINAIIEKWSDKNVRNFSDVLALDDAFRKKNDGKAGADVSWPKTENEKNRDFVADSRPEIVYERITATAKVPTRGSSGAAGYDLYADISEPIVIKPHEVAKIGTGLKIAVPEGYFGAIFARSGLAVKEQLAPANCVGVCDSDYRGEYVVAIQNNGNTDRTVVSGERIAQLIVMSYLTFELIEGKVDITARGSGGFGSTGK